MFKKIIKKEFAGSWLDSLIIAILTLVLFLVFVFPHLINIIFEIWDWFSLHDNYKISPENFSTDKNITEKQKAQEIHYQFIRNSGWALWVVISLSGLGYGLYLATRGRKTQEKQWKTQHDSHLHERYEKAANMLGSDIMAVRIAGCRALKSLGKDDKNMKAQCVRLLFSFIRNPYLDDKDIGFNKDKILNKNAALNKIFPRNKPLRDDVQEAADSFSEIYDKYKNEKIDDDLVILPDYFLRNIYKKPISLVKANFINLNLQETTFTQSDLQEAIFYRADLKEGNLSESNLQKINLQEAILHKANLQEANLQNANLSGAELQEANLEDAILQGANLNGADLQKTILIRAKLQKVNLIWANLQGADLREANLEKAKLAFAYLNETIFTGANLQEVDLTEVNLQGANLIGTNLQETNLYGAFFANAQLNEANLQEADLTSADMQDAGNLTKEQVLSAKWGIDESGFGEVPILPEELLDDQEVQEWLATPHYDLKNKKEGD